MAKAQTELVNLSFMPPQRVADNIEATDRRASSNSRQSSVSERRFSSPIGPKVRKIARSAKSDRPMTSSIPFKRTGRDALNSTSSSSV
jgi:hypothetical protein